jgi:hypothetical protein
MNLFELFVKIGVDDQASGKIDGLSKKLGNGLKTAAKIGVTSVFGIGAAAIKMYSDYEQLVGGVETLFKGSSQKVQKYAANAYKTAGLSANEYMSTVTSFSASLLQSLGGDTEAAAGYADQAITDMADNANKMGTSMEMIQNAYQGFAKQNYTMLDNLKLGYGGTKTEMERLVSDAAKLDSSIQANDLSFSNIVKSIHAVQTEMGITGTTAKEAEKTISGSAASMKAAFGNFLTSLADDNIDTAKAFEDLKDSVGTFLDNVMPKVWGFVEALGPIGPIIAGITAALVAFKIASAISGVVGALSKSIAAYKAANEGATIAQWAMNAAMNANPFVLVTTIIGGLVAAIMVLWNTNEDFKNAVIGIWEGIKGAFESAWKGIESAFSLSSVGDHFSKVWEAIKKPFSSVANWFRTTFTGAWTAVKKVFSSGGTIFGDIKEGIVSAFKTVVNAIIKGINTVVAIPFDTINWVLEKLRKIEILGAKPFGWIQTFSVPQIPLLYEGGILKKGQIGLLEGRGDEAVVPLHNNKKWISAVAEEFKDSGIVGNGGTVININIDGANVQDDETLADMIAERLQRMTERRGAVFA